MSERGPVVWFSYRRVGDDTDAAVEEITIGLPDAFSLFSAGTFFRAQTAERRYGLDLLRATVEIQVGEDGDRPPAIRRARLYLHDGEMDVPAVEIEATAKELSSALVLVPHVEFLAKKALEWAQAHANRAPTEE